MLWKTETYLTDGKQHAVIVDRGNVCCLWDGERWGRRAQLPEAEWRPALRSEIPAPMPGCALPAEQAPEAADGAVIAPKPKRKRTAKGKPKA